MIEKVFTVAFDFGDKVQFNNKIGRDEGLIVGIKATMDGGMLYEVSWSDKKQSYHYAGELKSAS